VGAEEPKHLAADHPEAVRSARGERDGVALAEQHLPVLVTLQPGFGGAVEDVEDQ